MTKNTKFFYPQLQLRFCFSKIAFETESWLQLTLECNSCNTFYILTNYNGNNWSNNCNWHITSNSQIHLQTWLIHFQSQDHISLVYVSLKYWDFFQIEQKRSTVVHKQFFFQIKNFIKLSIVLDFIDIFTFVQVM